MDSRYNTQSNRPRHFSLDDLERRMIEQRLARSLKLNGAPTLLMQREADELDAKLDRRFHSKLECGRIFGEVR